MPSWSGLARFIEYSRSIIASNARERYGMLSTALEDPASSAAAGHLGGTDVSGAATHASGEEVATFVGVLTTLCKELALAVEADEEVGSKGAGMAA